MPTPTPTHPPTHTRAHTCTHKHLHKHAHTYAHTYAHLHTKLPVPISTWRVVLSCEVSCCPLEKVAGVDKCSANGTACKLYGNWMIEGKGTKGICGQEAGTMCCLVMWLLQTSVYLMMFIVSLIMLISWINLLFTEVCLIDKASIV